MIIRISEMLEIVVTINIIVFIIIFTFINTNCFQYLVLSFLVLIVMMLNKIIIGLSIGK